ncbi:metallophosphoesterase [Sphingomonas qomolangmaensis]|uniref:Metallophosphoesterase n=1 Tax=Sphingomonas qomolangmaensis TaxID=2918765 RepID=A0ABY5L7C1_9SPHN|nr:metallophosphoesterase [Sphingomonas qomolangmaensis]UUL82342.1 metallophosphoesterase [Sphingomonas qomolangmaensis]
MIARFIWPLSIPTPMKIVLAIAVLVASQYHLWSRLSSGSVFSPEFPFAIVVLFNWAFGTIALLAVLLLALDLGTLVAWLVRRGASPPDGVRYAIPAGAAVLAAVAVSQAVRVPPVKEIEVRIAGLPAQFDGYTMLQLTDLHISRLFPERWTRAVVDKSNALAPDLIVVTGDFIDGTVERRRADVEPLRDLRARDGVMFIPGNHEYFFGYREWMRHLSAMGMRALENEHAVIGRGQGRLVIAGVTDLTAPGTGHSGPDVAASIAGAPAGAPIILLDHQPKNARAAAPLGVALQLSGHTHGGMIRGLDRIVARANGGFVSGRYQVGDMQLYVNNGTALWPGFALRLGRPSELTRITLRPAA